MLNVENTFESSTNMAREDREQYCATINTRCVQGFMERFNIVGIRKCGKFMISPVKQAQMEREVAFQAGSVAKAFRNGDLDEYLAENIDETHFVVNMDNGRNLAFVLDVVRSHMLT